MQIELPASQGLEQGLVFGREEVEFGIRALVLAQGLGE